MNPLYAGKHQEDKLIEALLINALISGVGYGMAARALGKNFNDYFVYGLAFGVVWDAALVYYYQRQHLRK